VALRPKFFSLSRHQNHGLGIGQEHLVLAWPRRLQCFAFVDSINFYCHFYSASVMFVLAPALTSWPWPRTFGCDIMLGLVSLV